MTTLFSFGYWGAGNATRALTEAVAAGEASRGFRPPLWVDIRIQRSVRAVGFRDNALGQLLGEQYLWMRELGNVAVAERTGGVRIQNPAAATALLDLARACPDRRIIFFCACELPRGCHRAEVARLVMRAARGDATRVVEWPGGEPRRIELTVSREVLRKVRRGAQTMLPVTGTMTAADAALVPWGSELRLHASGSDDRGSFITGPARFGIQGARLPILGGCNLSRTSRARGREATTGGSSRRNERPSLPC